MMMVFCSVVDLFRDIEMATPVIGELSRLIPRVYPSISTSSNVTNDPIEKELRLVVPMDPMLVHFRHHKATEVRLSSISMRCANLNEVVSMELTSLLLDLLLKWICFFRLGNDRSLVAGCCEQRNR